MKKKILAAIFAGLMAFGTFGDVQGKALLCSYGHGIGRWHGHGK